MGDGSAITTTVTHAFWVDEGASKPGWLEAGRLRVGDRLRTADGRDAVVVRLRRGVGRAVVYTLTVAHDHTFFVGAARVLVHNADCGDVAKAFTQLAQLRYDLGLPAAGSAQDRSTLATLEIGSRDFFGINAHGQQVTLKVNAISRTHAETDVFQQATNAGVRSSRARLFVDRPLCQACGQNGGVRSLARQLGIQELEVYAPDGYHLIRP